MVNSNNKQDTLSYKNLTKNDIHLLSNPKSTQNDGLQIELSDDSNDVSNQPLQTVHHTSNHFELNWLFFSSIHW